MAATITDKLSNTSNGVRPVSTTVATVRAAAVTTLACNDLTGWPTDTAVHFVTYKVDGQSKVIAGSQRDLKGIVSSNSLTSITLTDGNSDAGNAVGDIVEILPTSRWGKDLTDALRVSLNQDGTIKTAAIPAGSVGTPQVVDASITTAKIADVNITYAKLLATIFSGAVTTVTNAGTAGGSMSYVNLGGIKLLWGLSSPNSASASGSQYTFTLPGSFFTTIQMSLASPVSPTVTATQYANIASITTSSVLVTCIATTGSAPTQQTAILIIGT